MSSHNGLPTLLAPWTAPTLESMIRALFVATALSVAVAISACGDDSNVDTSTTPDLQDTPADGEPTASIQVSPESRPTDVPAAASPVVQTSTLGEITRRAEETPQGEALRLLTDATCANGLLVIHTSEETIYAALGCDRFSDQQFADLFAGRQVAVVLEVAPERYSVLIETVEGATAQFTPDGIWVE